jgi:phosphatidate cytidylyltransferase
MLAKRAASAAAIIIFGILLVIAGGWVYTIGVALILIGAASEYTAMFRKGGYFPADYVIIAGTFITALASQDKNPEYFLLAISLFILIVIAWHILTIVFIAFLGSYIIRLRFLPDGFYWLLMAIGAAGISDIGAYLIGSAIGSHKMAPALSPGKTIEGYLGGVLTASVTGYAVGAVAAMTVPYISGLNGLIVGLAVGVFCPLGDLGKSLLKRQFNLKHTSDLIPGHGGVLDRVDTWLWAGVISYYLITTFFL